MTSPADAPREAAASSVGTEDTVALGPGASGLVDGAPPSRLREGEVVDRYAVVGLLGAGGMAEVYRARDRRLGREVALKFVRPLAGEGAACGALCSLLHREARTMAQLSHPGLLTVHDVGEHRGCVYLAMELIEGTTLREWTRTAPPWRERLGVLLQAGAALAAAHAARVVHRDVKPDNVLIDRGGRVVVSDFGLARSLVDLDDDAGYACGCTSGVAPRVSLEGMVVGTPHYMSPEQHEGGAADARSDQFSFAVTAWETLYGALPFQGAGLEALHAAVVAQRVEAPPPSEVPGAVEGVLRRGMRAAASARFPSLADFVERLAAAAS